MDLNAERLLASAFKKCGIYSVNAEEVFDRLPSTATSQAASPIMNESLLKVLEERRYGHGWGGRWGGWGGGRGGCGRRVQPGCSFSAQSESEESEISGIDDLPDVEEPDLAGENDALSNHSDSMGGEELQLEVDDDGL